MWTKIKGFTLIELLVVVAIIAILAAIAVPNFLEAQVRAKVSRAKSDMRSVALALESYRTDQNCYPYLNRNYDGLHPNILVDLSNTTSTNVDAFMLSGSLSYRNMSKGRVFNSMSLLTTPIAYITNAPLDPFLNGRKADGYGDLDVMVSYTFVNVELACKAYQTPGMIWYGVLSKNIPVNPAPFRLVRNMPAAESTYNTTSAASEPVRYASYMLFSAGPECRFDDLYKFFLVTGTGGFTPYVHYTATHAFTCKSDQYSPPYDPTNGTKSAGKIFRLSGGQWE